MDSLLHTLKDREARVLRKRFGLAGEAVPTLDEIGFRFMGLTRQRVRRIEVTALKKLRRNALQAGMTYAEST